MYKRQKIKMRYFNLFYQLLFVSVDSDDDGDVSIVSIRKPFLIFHYIIIKKAENNINIYQTVDSNKTRIIIAREIGMKGKKTHGGQLVVMGNHLNQTPSTP